MGEEALFSRVWRVEDAESSLRSALCLRAQPGNGAIELSTRSAATRYFTPHSLRRRERVLWLGLEACKEALCLLVPQGFRTVRLANNALLPPQGSGLEFHSDIERTSRRIKDLNGRDTRPLNQEVWRKTAEKVPSLRCARTRKPRRCHCSRNRHCHHQPINMVPRKEQRLRQSRSGARICQHSVVRSKDRYPGQRARALDQAGEGEPRQPPSSSAHLRDRVGIPLARGSA